MKKVLLILILIAGVGIAYIPLKNQIPIEADEFIKEDSITNKNLAIHQLDSIFNGRKIVTPLYHNFNPKYELLSSSQKSKIDKKNELYQLYSFRPEQLTNWEYPLHVLSGDIRVENSQRGKERYEPLNGGSFYGIWQSGWALGCAKMISEDKYICYMVIPYLVGYLRQSESFYYEFKPTIREALNTAYDFFTRDEQSEFVNFIGNNNLEKFMSLVSETYQAINANNFTLEKIENEKSDFESADPGVFDGTNYMYNEYIRVYIGMVYRTTYKLKYNSEWAQQYKEQYIEEQEQKLQKHFIIIECILAVILVLLVVIHFITKRKAKETILDRIIEVSNPKQYMKNYDQNKIDIANQIYNKARNTKLDEKEIIEELCYEIETKLCGVLVNKRDLTALIQRCNPKHFLKPYNAEKITKANALFARLKQGNISYSDFLKIKEEIEELYK